MVTINSHTTFSNLQHAPYTPLLEDPYPSSFPAISRRNSHRFQGFVVIIASIMFLMSLVAIVVKQGQEHLLIPDKVVSPLKSSFSEDLRQLPRGVAQGVSAKSSYRSFSDDQEVSYNWTNAMFSWQRTGFHFQPAKNWMNDPDGPLFHMGWYHLFYQYNPDSAVWGNITWGHAVSKDLIHWLYLPLAMVPDQWFDLNGVWTGSATILPNGKIIMLYTGDTDNYVQVQNLAYPADLSDPLLLEWIKYPNNPVLVPPPGISLKEFRDPTTAWIGSDGKWRITIGSKVNKTGIALVYTTTNFITYELLDNYLHEVPGTGMWECVDFYPVSMTGSNGLDTSANGPDIKHVLKASLDDTKRDHYAIGTYYPENDTWVPDNPAEDVGIGLQVDYGRYYASKTFYDQNKERRILWGWINETDTEADDLAKGWASVQTIPRTVVFDNKTKTNILQWPVEEVESLRLSSREFTSVEVGPGSVVPLDIGSGSQLDIIAEFEYELLESKVVAESNELESCSGGAAERSLLGPFGLLVLADQTLSEMTPVYFHVARSSNSTFKTFFCTDESRSSKAPDVFKHNYGSTVPVLDDEKLQMRVLVDHSIVESFGQGGRRVITSRIYPTEAIYGAARLFLFNNATGVNVKATLKIWHMDSAFIHYFPLD